MTEPVRCDSDIERAIREAAGKATPGPWKVERIDLRDGHIQYDVMNLSGEHYDRVSSHHEVLEGKQAKANAAYIALANPQAVLQVLDAYAKREGEMKVEIAAHEATDALFEEADFPAQLTAAKAEIERLQSEKDALEGAATGALGALSYLLDVCDLAPTVSPGELEDIESARQRVKAALQGANHDK